jgi:hypothetical protein
MLYICGSSVFSSYFSVSQEADRSIMPSPRFFATRLFASRFSRWRSNIGSSWGSCRLFTHFADVVHVLRSTLLMSIAVVHSSLRNSDHLPLCPSLPFFLRGASVVSSSASLLSVFLSRPCPWSNYPWRCSSCVMPLLHGGTPSFGIHNLLGSVPLASRGALQLDAGPCAANSALCQFPLRHLP